MVPALDRLRDAGIRCVAFSNGTEDAVNQLLTRAGGEKSHGRRGECRRHQALQARPRRLRLSSHTVRDAAGNHMAHLQ